MVAPVVLSGLKLLTSTIGLAETVLKRKTPSEAKELGKLKLKLIGLIRQRSDEEEKLDPHDKLIQKLYKDEVTLNEEIEVYIELANSQQRSIDS